MAFVCSIDRRRWVQGLGRRLAVITYAVVALLATTADAQDHPDFSGTWTLLSDKGMSFGKEFRAMQDATRLRIDSTSYMIGGTVSHLPVRTELGAPASWRTVETQETVATPWQWVYRLDGSETKNPVIGLGVAGSVSKAAWDGNRLVMVTTRDMTVSLGVPDQQVPSRTTTKQVMWLEGDGTLAVEEIRTFDTGLSSRTPAQTLTKGVYTRK